MPFSELNDPEHWRVLAKDARAIATKTTTVFERNWLMSMAEGYDRIAKHTEEHPILALSLIEG